MMFCVVCKDETNKYKCPKCLAFYCSLNCCKAHKKEGCETKTIAREENVEKDDLKLILPFTTEDTVNPDKLEALKESEGLRNLLYNRHLRALLKEIDEAPKAWKAMRAAMQEPLFLEFADECLKIIEPPEKEENV